MTPLGIEPATFQLVAQHLSQLCHCVPHMIVLCLIENNSKFPPPPPPPNKNIFFTPPTPHILKK